MSASFAACRKSSWFRPRTKCQQATPKITTAAVVSPTSSTWMYAQIPKRFEKSSQTFVSSALPSTMSSRRAAASTSWR